MNRLEVVRTQFEQAGIDALLVDSPTNRRYLSRFTGTAGAVLLTANDAFLITDFRYVEQAKSQSADFDIVQHENGAMSEEIQKLLEKESVQYLGFEKAYTSYEKYELYNQAFSAELVPVAGIVENPRMFKSQDELKTMKKAAGIADAAFEHIVTYIRAGIRERDIANELEFFMREQGAESSSFDIIVASGERGARPHGVASDKQVEKGDLITMDFGAYYDGYCSDITRTVAVGEVSDELRDVYDTVLQAQLKSVEKIKAGMTGIEADAIARELIYAEGYEGYFGHGLGHGLGMDVHEEPRLSMKGNLQLEPDMVVTVEPGIYLPGKGGVRIEDDIVITEEGNERLTTSDKTLKIIEA
ncbi:M24 family metallopeptidase [Natribacillus halophilus]|uniref:Xaa-Pro aminopeptidase n=1 Tax=Natribacillus halophilus TaxID=549003 RepID=A0A1G8JLF7_9BACI|nr:Xaa-Pro peptidase family protein [Natribacillus halophilus]SDI31873.1 Xaa-Pro aminopeptidase [Natribacillus halophilus]